MQNAGSYASRSNEGEDTKVKTPDDHVLGQKTQHKNQTISEVFQSEDALP